MRSLLLLFVLLSSSFKASAQSDIDTILNDICKRDVQFVLAKAGMTFVNGQARIGHYFISPDDDAIADFVRRASIATRVGLIHRLHDPKFGVFANLLLYAITRSGGVHMLSVDPEKIWKGRTRKDDIDYWYEHLFQTINTGQRRDDIPINFFTKPKAELALDFFLFYLRRLDFINPYDTSQICKTSIQYLETISCIRANWEGDYAGLRMFSKRDLLLWRRWHTDNMMARKKIVQTQH